MKSKIINNDCLTALKEMEDNSIDSIVSDPPYGISFMGKKWDYDVPKVEVWKECLRVLKPGGHALIACGTRTQHRMAVNLEDAGFEIRDIVAWVYGSGFPKSHNIGKSVDKLQGNDREVTGRYTDPSGAEYKQTGHRKNFTSGNSDKVKNCSDDRFILTKGTSPYEGWGTALKPSFEIWSLCRKPLTAVLPFDIIGIDNNLIKFLCQLLNVKFVEKTLELNSQELKGELDFALLNVVIKTIQKKEELKEEMDIFKSQETEKMFWNIVSLWSNILEENYKRQNKSITSTTIVLTTELKTLNYLILSNTQESVQDQKTQTNGMKQNVKIVEELSSVVCATLENILIAFAPENAIAQAILLSNKEKEITRGKETTKVGLSEKVNMELWTLCRKPLEEKTIASNVLKYGTGGINIDQCRVKGNYKWRASDSKIKGDIFKEGSFGEKSSIGRFPANLIHDGSDEVVEGFPETHKAGNKKLSPITSGKSIFGIGDKGKRNPKIPGDNGGSASRFFYCAKASKSERNKGLEGFEEKLGGSLEGGDDKRNGQPQMKMTKNNHPTVKPIKLMQYLCRLITPKGGTILDLYVGSGSTGIGAKLEDFNFIGIEREKEYCTIAEARIKAWKKDLTLFDNEKN